MRPEFDKKDSQILAEREAAYNKRTGPRVGDWVEMPNGDMLRFTHDWGNEIQTTCPTFPQDQSFYFGGDYVSFSGSLDSPIQNVLGAHAGYGHGKQVRDAAYDLLTRIDGGKP